MMKPDKKPIVLVDSFAVGLDNLPKKQQKSIYDVMVILSRHDRFSVFEASASKEIAKTLTEIIDKKLILITGGEYPWHEYLITDLGIYYIKNKRS